MKILGLTEASGYRRTFIAEVTEDELKSAFEKGYDSTDFSKLKAGDVLNLGEAVSQREKVITATRAMQSAYDAFMKVAPVMTEIALVERNTMSTLYPYQQRVVDEKNALDANIGKPADFIVLSAAYKHLGSAEKGRLHRQHTHMLAYSGVLLERIEAFTA
jgi:hypothetical protein